MKAILVIGASYGDEGKGLATDYYCAQEMRAGKRVVVVRANGGTQAAHTVKTKTGMGHIFKTFGSGTLLGAPTYYGPEFIFNPIGFNTELIHLAAWMPQVYSSPDAIVSLPIDMMLNQMMEELRGGQKHGSCGWGIGETVERSQTAGWRVTMADLAKLDLATLVAISDDYAAYRLNRLGKVPHELPENWKKLLQNDGVLYKFIEDSQQALQRITLLPPDQLDTIADTIVFEGAQGLGLDQIAGHFPHVTRSYTGSTNPLAMLQQMTLNGTKEAAASVEVCYVTRAYATRHGAGPLEHEGEPFGCLVVDETNVPNKWQDNLRHAPLDINLTAARIAQDLSQVLQVFPYAKFAQLMTCVDQAGDTYRYMSDDPHPTGKPCNPLFAQGRMAALVRSFCYTVGYETYGMKLFVSRGPTRNDVKLETIMDGTLANDLSKVLEKMRPAQGG